MQTVSSASRACRALRSASEYTATEAMPSRRSVRRMRQAMAPRLAINTLSNTRALEPRPDQYPYGCRIVGVAGIVQLRAVGDQHQHVDVRAHLHIAASR